MQGRGHLEGKGGCRGDGEDEGGVGKKELTCSFLDPPKNQAPVF